MVVYAFTSPDNTRGADIGEPFKNTSPRHDGSFDIELGVILPDLLPALDGRNEYTLDIALEGTPARRLALSNVMMKLRYQVNGQHYHALVHRSLMASLRRGEFGFIPTDAHEEPVKTFVTSRFGIKGATAADALDEHLSDTFDGFLAYLNHLLRMVSMMEEIPGTVLSTSYTRSTFDTFYFFLVGDSMEQDRLGHGQAMSHGGKAVLNPPVLSPDQTAFLKGLLDGTTQPLDTHALIHAARRYLESGAFDFSVLLGVVAAEIATRRFVVERCLELGVSKTKMDNYKSDYKFSMLLNVELFILAPADMKPDRDLIGKVNRAREVRNTYMHEGKGVKDRETAHALLGDAFAYIKYIDMVRDRVASQKVNRSGDLADS